MLNNKNWDYEIGDLVSHKSLGTGIVVDRSTMSYHEMARPVKIVDREMYTVCFGSSEKNQMIRGDQLISNNMD